MIDKLSTGCRLLAVGAWVAALAWFAVATVASWGFTPVGVLLWSPPAALLMRRTLAWWSRVGDPLPAHARACLVRLWRALAIACAAVYAPAVGWYDAALVLDQWQRRHPADVAAGFRALRYEHIGARL